MSSSRHVKVPPPQVTVCPTDEHDCGSGYVPLKNLQSFLILIGSNYGIESKIGVGWGVGFSVGAGVRAGVGFGVGKSTPTNGSLVKC